LSEILVVVPVYNEMPRIAGLLDRARVFPVPDADYLFVDDASDDGTEQALATSGFLTLRNPARLGCGPAIRRGLDYGLEKGYEVAVVMAGNGKDDPAEIPGLLEPILARGFDFVQGSRYLEPGSASNMPFARRCGTRLYSLLFSLLARRRVTDGTNGFRAFRFSILKDPRIDLHQAWLKNYEVESYLFSSALRLGYRFAEAPVRKTYPRQGPYTKMQALTGWWSHFRPVLFVFLGLKK
jgi:dolichol-phosphate mannosyltransferase